jgi:hypothetical protein
MNLIGLKDKKLVDINTPGAEILVHVEIPTVWFAPAGMAQEILFRPKVGLFYRRSRSKRPNVRSILRTNISEDLSALIKRAILGSFPEFAVYAGFKGVKPMDEIDMQNVIIKKELGI